MVFMTDPFSGERVRVECIREIQIKFDIIRRNGSSFKLYREGELVGTVEQEHLHPKTRSMLMSLSE